jgi:hypothetical protein
MAAVHHPVRRIPTLGKAASIAVVALALAACSAKPATAPTSTTAAPVKPTTTTEAPLTAGRQVSFYVPAVGDCYDKRMIGAAPNAVQIWLVLPCTLPHQNEVFATVDFPDPNFPSGVGVLEQFAKQRCVSGFAAYVGKPYETSSYDIDYELPQEASWGNGIRHVIGCLVVPHDGTRITGSVKGSGQ